MTSVVAWERIYGTGSELIVASDSRLSGGEEWDACAKIFNIGREDSVLAFSGMTWRALPLVLQAIATTRSYEGSAVRTLDLPEFAGHLERVINGVLSQARGPAAEEDPDCEFLLAGWSWKMGGFRIYRYRFSKDLGRFHCWAPRRLPSAIRGRGRGSLYAAIGSGATRLTGSIAESYNRGLISGGLHFHPLEHLYQQTLDPAEHSVGGAVQVAKVYRSIRVEHFAVRVGGLLTISGRSVLPYENLSVRTLARDVSGGWSIEP